MNKNEAIELLKEMSKESFKMAKIHAVYIDSIVEVVNEIDEPQKVVVPKFVAEWLKKYRHAHTLVQVLKAVENEQVVPSTVNDWILDNQYDFVKAWFDGCDIEKEVETDE